MYKVKLKLAVDESFTGLWKEKLRYGERNVIFRGNTHWFFELCSLCQFTIIFDPILPTSCLSNRYSLSNKKVYLKYSN